MSAQLFSLRSAFCLAALLFHRGETVAQSPALSPHQITHVYQDEPCYSPDGKKILFVNDDDGPANVYVMNAEGRPAVRRLTSDSLDADGPVWSPDGTLIAFAGKEHGGPREIYIMSADGSNLRQLTHDQVQDMHPSWSPEGSRILYTTTRDSPDQKNPVSWGTYSIRLDGGNQTSIFGPNGINTYASLSPDGSKLLFRRKTDGGRNSQVFVMNVDGTRVRKSDQFASVRPVSVLVTRRETDCF